LRGKKTGGRKKGTPNKANAERQAAIAASGIDPLTYMLRVMNDPKADVRRRDEMARAAAPYTNARLASVEMTGKDGGPIEHDLLPHLTDAEKAKAILEMLKKK
jgi:hypothetical protein